MVDLSEIVVEVNSTDLSPRRAPRLMSRPEAVNRASRRRRSTADSNLSAVGLVRKNRCKASEHQRGTRDGVGENNVSRSKTTPALNQVGRSLVLFEGRPSIPQFSRCLVELKNAKPLAIVVVPAALVALSGWRCPLCRTSRASPQPRRRVAARTRLHRGRKPTTGYERASGRRICNSPGSDNEATTLRNYARLPGYRGKTSTRSQHLSFCLSQRPMPQEHADLDFFLCRFFLCRGF